MYVSSGGDSEASVSIKKPLFAAEVTVHRKARSRLHG